MKRETKKDILHTGMRLFFENGYDRVSVNMICEACGITKGSFYYHYPSKESLLLDYHSLLETNYVELISSLENCANWREKIWLLKLMYIEHFTKLNKDLLKNLIRIDMEQGNEIFNPSIDNQDPVIKDIRLLAVTYTKKAQEAGEISPELSPEILSQCFASCFLGAATYWCSTESDMSLVDISRSYFDILYR